MQPIIKVENLSKSYIIGHQREPYTALRDVIVNKTRHTKKSTDFLIFAGNEESLI